MGALRLLCAGIARVNGAPLFDTGGLTCDPSAHPWRGGGRARAVANGVKMGASRR
jgi:hypothetical protein